MCDSIIDDFGLEDALAKANHWTFIVDQRCKFLHAYHLTEDAGQPCVLIDDLLSSCNTWAIIVIMIRLFENESWIYESRVVA